MIDLNSTEELRYVGSATHVSTQGSLMTTTASRVAAVGGVPEGCLLLAVPRPIAEPWADPVTAVLCRALSVKANGELIAARDAHERSSVRHGDPRSSTKEQYVDQPIKELLSVVTLEIEALGVYSKSIDGEWTFGAGVSSMHLSEHFDVFVASGEMASNIVSTGHGAPSQVTVGRLRYSAAEASSKKDPAVNIDVLDFAGNKTGLFGTTRSGKSNTTKVIISRLVKEGHRRWHDIRDNPDISDDVKNAYRPFGHVIFDPQGEYANSNVQDNDVALKDISSDTRIYSGMTKRGDSNHRSFGVNFFDADQKELIQKVLRAHLESPEVSGGDYVAALANANFMARSQRDRKNAAAGLGLLMVAMYQAGCQIRDDQKVSIPMPGDIATRVLDMSMDPEGMLYNGECLVMEGADGMSSFADAIKLGADENRSQKKEKSPVAEAFDEVDKWASRSNVTRAVMPFITQINRGSTVSGWMKLVGLVGLHSADASSDVRAEVYEHLLDGKMAIVDLSRGDIEHTQKLAAIVIEYIFMQQQSVFTSGETPRCVQVVVEEAHNLFKPGPGGKMSIWSKVAKEGSKLNIGMMYATQEISSIDNDILSNTANIVAAYLNNRDERMKLAKFFDLGSHIQGMEHASAARGFVRLRTLSSSFTVPCQIDKFDSSMVRDVLKEERVTQRSKGPGSSKRSTSFDWDED